MKHSIIFIGIICFLIFGNLNLNAQDRLRFESQWGRSEEFKTSPSEQTMQTLNKELTSTYSTGWGGGDGSDAPDPEGGDPSVSGDAPIGDGLIILLIMVLTSLFARKLRISVNENKIKKRA